MASTSRIITLAVLILASASLPSSSSVAASSSTAKRSNPIIINAAPPRISIQQLRSSSLQQSDLLEQQHDSDADTATSTTSINLHQLLHESHGILRIAVEGVGNNDVDGFSDLRKHAFSHICECPSFQSTSSSNNDGIFSAEALESHPQDLQQLTFLDGTVRRTLATASVGLDDNDYSSSSSSSSALLELPSWVGDECGQDAYDSSNELRNAVADVVNAFVERLDIENRLMNTRGGEEKEDEGNYYRQILSSVTHLEHFHLYTKSSSTSSSRQVEERDLLQSVVGDLEKERSPPSNTLDYHTDAGFFLSFVPAMNCRSRTIDNASFFLKGQEEPVMFKEDELVILMGAGAEHWLPSREQSNRGSNNGSGDGQKEFPFLAASHALRLAPDTHRAWYGKMHLLPSSFAKDDVQASSTTSVSHGGGSHEEVTPNLLQEQHHSLDTAMMQTQSLRQQRRKLQRVNSPADCNNQTNFFCWHQCIDVPTPSSNSDDTDNSSDGYSLVCLDPAILASSSSGSNSLKDATEPCEGGYAHSSKCIPSWQAMMVEDALPESVGVDVDSHILGGLFSMTKKGWVVLGLGVFGFVAGAYAVGFALRSKSEYRRLP